MNELDGAPRRGPTLPAGQYNICVDAYPSADDGLTGWG
jgi:hypothetical protein